MDMDKEALTCSRCGYCNAVCPTFEEIGWESASPRGKLYYSKRLSSGRMAAASTYAERMFQCTLCGHCKEVCQSRIDTLSVWKTLRGRLGKKGLWPSQVKDLNESIGEYRNVYRIPNSERNIWAFEVEDLIATKMAKEAKFAYFVGCTSSFVGRISRIPIAMVRVLEEAAVDYTVLGPEEWCCGSPIFLMGGVEEAEGLVRHNVEWLRMLGVEAMVTTCAGCYKAFKHDYPLILGEDLGFEVLHSTELLEKFVDQDKIRFRNSLEGYSVTYHDPCELGRHCRVFEPPRKVLESVHGLSLNELPKSKENSRCCGGGGLIKASYPKIAARIGLKKVAEAVQTGAQAIVSGCPACKLNILEAASEAGSSIAMVDIVEVVAEALGVLAPSDREVARG